MNEAIAMAGRMRALGAMSGTSLDGVDAAFLDTDGCDIFGFGDTGYRSYSQAERRVIAAGFGKWHGADVDAAQAVVQAAHLELLGGMKGAEIIGFHGQTLAHAPRAQGTLQVGDGAALARALGVPV
uniref:anhydro-N-acetylmuramic acid kinase n=1 Tax=Blastomonas sp. TaxID=1909299 RepID=UPI0035944DB0